MALKIKDPADWETFETELDFYLGVDNHDNILKMSRSKESAVMTSSEGKKEVQYFALEYAPNGDLYDHMAILGAFPEEIARFYFKQILEALTVIHESRFAHRDLRPENLLLSSDFTLKLADFDLSCKRPVKKFSGCPSCLSPEVIERRDFDNDKVDLYSSVIILFIMVTGKRPFKKAGYGDYKFYQIMVDNWTGFWELQEVTASGDFMDFVEKTLCYDASKRLSMQEMKSHSWYNGNTAGLQEAAAWMLQAAPNSPSSPSGSSHSSYKSEDFDQQDQDSFMGGLQGSDSHDSDSKNFTSKNNENRRTRDTNSAPSTPPTNISISSSFFDGDREDDSIFGSKLKEIFSSDFV